MPSTRANIWATYVVVVGAARRDGEAAVAGGDGGDAVQRRRVAERVPGELRVVVGVDVDDARRDHQAVGVDHLVGRLAREPADGGDAPVADRDVGDLPGQAGAVDDEAAADQQVVGHESPASERRDRVDRAAGAAGDAQRVHGEQDLPALPLGARHRERLEVHVVDQVQARSR